ncbi:phenoloxidase-activating factor 2-like [Toxorhynchites rutilus septentrionalis]|uniref:phenoloxidase-activating factor 2-like n=1 Tax=Toxorhynchites rutilus septentrionalis TaxID=329112 RepID=UPI002479C485|nr:phenoloxidase-activating factor 2-like [Toxorhynchites rutilus septentrionalis]
MAWREAVLVCIYCYVVFALPQVVRRPTTQDPISLFFNPQCNAGRGTCTRDCKISNQVESDDCNGILAVCCMPDRNDGISFPTRPTYAPPLAPTKSSQPTTTSTTTTEEPPDDGWFVPDCGVRQSRTDINSQSVEDAQRGEFPWNVGVFTISENEFGIEQNVFHCGGSLIDEFTVMTAASCVRRKNASSLFVFAGLLNIEDHQERRQVRKVSQIILHPSFKPSSKVYDIAILFLDDKVDFSRTVNRICLPDSSVDFANSYCLVTGWGVTPTDETVGRSVRPIMKVIELPLVDHKQCETKLRKIVSPNNVFQLKETFQCAGEEEGINVCPRDIGSPLVCTIPGRDRQFYQVGIFSWSESMCGRRAIPSAFTKVSHFRKWIDEHIESEGRLTIVYIPQPEELGED